MTADADAAFSKLLADHQSQVIDWAWDEYNTLMDACESPIEELMVPHLLMMKPEMCGRRWGGNGDHRVEMQLLAQHVVGDFRVDFALIVRPVFDARPALQIAIECDGHEWHDATKEAAERDKRRTNALQIAGWNVLRFTGSEITRNAAECAERIERMINAHILRGITQHLGDRFTMPKLEDGE